MKLTSVLLFSAILVAAVPLAFAQNNKAFEDFLKKDASAWQSYQVIMKAYQDDPELKGLITDFISYHTQLADTNLMGTMQALAKALESYADTIDKTAAFMDAKSKFIETAKTSFKKDDEFKAQLEDDQLAAWLFNAAAFLAAENAAFVMFQQDKAADWRVGTAVLTFETGVLVQAISAGKRDDASLGDLFRKQTMALLKWINKIPLESRK